MLRTTLIGIIALLVLMMPTSKVAAANDSALFIKSLCEFVKIDNRFKVRKKLKGARLKLRKAYSGIRCEGKKLHAYAVEHNAVEMIKFIELKIKPENR
jgi:hypothetical protein